MNTARIVVLTIALGAGGVAAYLAREAGDTKPAPTEPVTQQLPTVDILVAKADIGLGQSVKQEDLQWQNWPAATASNNFIRRDSKPGAIKDVIGSIARTPFIAGDIVTSEIILANIRELAIDQAPKEKDGQNAVVGKTVTLELKPEQIATLTAGRQAGTLSLALRSIGDVNMVEDLSNGPALKRGQSINVVRYGVQSSITAQK